MENTNKTTDEPITTNSDYVELKQKHDELLGKIEKLEASIASKAGSTGLVTSNDPISRQKQEEAIKEKAKQEYEREQQVRGLEDKARGVLTPVVFETIKENLSLNKDKYTNTLKASMLFEKISNLKAEDKELLKIQSGLEIFDDKNRAKAEAFLKSFGGKSSLEEYQRAGDFYQEHNIQELETIYDSLKEKLVNSAISHKQKTMSIGTSGESIQSNILLRKRELAKDRVSKQSLNKIA